MKPVTKTHLQAVVDRINILMCTPAVPYLDGFPCAGCYFLDWAYGRVALVQLGTHGTGERDVFRIGHVPKRELLGLLNAFIEGVTEGRKS